MIQRHRISFVLVAAITACYTSHLNLSSVDGFVNPSLPTTNPIKTTVESRSLPALFASTSTGDETSNKTPAPVLNGKRVLPSKIMLAGLKGHQVAAAYAILSPEYKKAGGDGWVACQHVGVTRDLAETLKELTEKHGKDRVAHVRALSFLIPSDSAMESIAADWRKEALQVKGMTNFDPILAAMDVEDFLDDDDDDEFDDDDDDEYFEMMADALSASRGVEEQPKKEEEQIVSPFDQPSSYATTDGESLQFNKENVDTVLDEIRPYLISDGGNVSVDSVDEKTKNVYLKLEGACGSCPSSTVTMQMGIERVLKENFADLGEVLQVEDADDKPKELTYQTVENEVNRIKPAIIAMGGLVDILEVDAIGTIKLRFRGANKIRSGLEMALLDIDFVKHVEFVSE